MQPSQMRLNLAIAIAEWLELAILDWLELASAWRQQYPCSQEGRAGQFRAGIDLTRGTINSSAGQGSQSLGSAGWLSLGTIIANLEIGHIPIAQNTVHSTLHTRLPIYSTSYLTSSRVWDRYFFSEDLGCCRNRVKSIP